MASCHVFPFASTALSLPKRYPIREMLSQLVRSGVLDHAQAEGLQSILAVRNKLAHGRDASSDDIRVGLDMMQTTESFLDAYIADHEVPDV